MSRRGALRAIAIALIVILVVAAAGLLIFASPGGGLKSQDNGPVNQRLAARSTQLRDLQEQSNTARASISAAFDLLDKAFNLIRQPGGAGLAEAKSAWAGAPEAMNQAREANKRLPQITQSIVDEAGKSRTDIRKVFPSLRKQAEIDYMRAVDAALESLIQTEVEYSKMNQALSSGFTHYETLFERTDKFLKEQSAGKYRTPSEAAQVYTIATSSLIEPLQQFREQLDELEKAAAASGAGTTQAFRRAAALRP